MSYRLGKLAVMNNRLIKIIVLLLAILLHVEIYSMEGDKDQNSTNQSVDYPSSDESPPYYEWPMLHAEEDVVEAILNYINDLDFFAKRRAIKKIKEWLATQENEIAIEDNEVNQLLVLSMQSIRFDN